MIDFLREQGVSEKIIDGIEEYRVKYPWFDSSRTVIRPRFFYYGKKNWESAAAAIIAGENLLLAGAKASGKNVLAENLAAAFGRPDWIVSLHINMDASFMIGSDTFSGGEVKFRPGPVYQCAKLGGFGIFDEINMARNEALAVLHSLLDFRRVMDVPGYDRLRLHPAARFIATMNYGYAGTRELNEALASRFVVLQLSPPDTEDFEKLLSYEFPDILPEAKKIFISIFSDLQKKFESGEISSHAVDLRGILASLSLIRAGLSARQALEMGISGKVFENDERTIVEDVISISLPGDMRVFGDQ